LLCLSAQQSGPAAGKDGWISMFDGKTLDGWKAGDNPESWKVVDGAIVGNGQRSHLFLDGAGMPGLRIPLRGEVEPQRELGDVRPGRVRAGFSEGL
jgi:hypothetical protein